MVRARTAGWDARGGCANPDRLTRMPSTPLQQIPRQVVREGGHRDADTGGGFANAHEGDRHQEPPNQKQAAGVRDPGAESTQTPPSRPRRQRSDTTPLHPPALLLFGVITASRRTQRLTGANECEGIENDESAFVRPRSRGWEGEGRVQGRGIAGAGRAGGKCGGRRRLQLRSLRRQHG